MTCIYYKGSTEANGLTGKLGLAQGQFALLNQQLLTGDRQESLTLDALAFSKTSSGYPLGLRSMEASSTLLYRSVPAKRVRTCIKWNKYKRFKSIIINQNPEPNVHGVLCNLRVCRFLDNSRQVQGV